MGGISLDSTLAWLWDALIMATSFQHWPDGDPQAWRELGDSWLELSNAINDSFTEMNASAANVGLSWGGDAGTAFIERWSQFVSSDPSGPAAFGGAAYEYYSACYNGALNLEYSQLMCEIILEITAIEVIIGLAFAEFGGEAFSVAAIAAGRVAVKTVLERLAAMLTKEALTQLLKNAGKLALKAVVIGAVKGGLTFGAADLMAQQIQINEGYRDKINWTSIRDNAISGAVAGFVGYLSGGLLRFGGSALSKAGKWAFQSGAKNELVEPLAKRETSNLLGTLGRHTVSLGGKVTTGGLVNIPTMAALDITQHTLKTGQFGFSPEYLDRMANHPLQELWSQFAAGAFAAGVHGVVEGGLHAVMPSGRTSPADLAITHLSQARAEAHTYRELELQASREASGLTGEARQAALDRADGYHTLATRADERASTALVAANNLLGGHNAPVRVESGQSGSIKVEGGPARGEGARVEGGRPSRVEGSQEPTRREPVVATNGSHDLTGRPGPNHVPDVEANRTGTPTTAEDRSRSVVPEQTPGHPGERDSVPPPTESRDVTVSSTDSQSTHPNEVRPNEVRPNETRPNETPTDQTRPNEGHPDEVTVDPAVASGTDPTRGTAPPERTNTDASRPLGPGEQTSGGSHRVPEVEPTSADRLAEAAPLAESIPVAVNELGAAHRTYVQADRQAWNTRQGLDLTRRAATEAEIASLRGNGPERSAPSRDADALRGLHDNAVEARWGRELADAGHNEVVRRINDLLSRDDLPRSTRTGLERMREAYNDVAAHNADAGRYSDRVDGTRADAIDFDHRGDQRNAVKAAERSGDAAGQEARQHIAAVRALGAADRALSGLPDVVSSGGSHRVGEAVPDAASNGGEGGRHTPEASDRVPGDEFANDHFAHHDSFGQHDDLAYRGEAPEPTTWSGEGRTLDPVSNAAADRLLTQAARAESEITPRMRDLAADSGGRLYGEEFSLKSEDSLKRKLADEILDKPGDTLPQHLASMKDSVRYTVGFSHENYTAGARDVVDHLLHATDEHGNPRYEPVKFKNFWTNDEGYVGINSFWRDKATGQVFELQIHSEASFAAKMGTHEAYEIARTTDDAALKQRVEAEANAEFAKVPRPRGAADIRLPDEAATIRPASPHEATAPEFGGSERPRSGTPPGAEEHAAPPGAEDRSGPTTVEHPADIPDQSRHPEQHGDTPLDDRSRPDPPSPYVTDAEALDLVRDNVRATPSGYSFYPDGDRLIRFAEAVKPRAGVVNLDLHGNTRGFRIDGRTLSGEQFAHAIDTMVREGHIQLADGQEVRLSACDVARGDNSPAEQFARASQRPVTAPTERMWSDRQGNEWVSSAVLKKGRWVPAEPEDGRWRSFDHTGTEKTPDPRRPAGEQPPASGGSRSSGRPDLAEALRDGSADALADRQSDHPASEDGGQHRAEEHPLEAEPHRPGEPRPEPVETPRRAPEPAVMLRDSTPEELRRIGVGEATLADLGFPNGEGLTVPERTIYENALTHTAMVPTRDLLYTQRSVSRATSDGIPIHELAAHMHNDGWRGGPVHAVRWGDGSLDSIDNRRLTAATAAGLERVPVAVHNPSERLTDWPQDWTPRRLNNNKLGVDIRELADGTWVVGGDEGQVVFAKGTVPATFGDIALFRAAEQRSLLPGDLFGSDTTPVFIDKLPPPLGRLATDHEATVLSSWVTQARPDADRIMGDLEAAGQQVGRHLGLDDAVKLRGEDYRVKTEDSLIRKFETESLRRQATAPNPDERSALLERFRDEANDIVRFSLVLPEGAGYKPALDDVLARLTAPRSESSTGGYTLVDTKNFWHAGNRYYGFNATLRSPEGRLFELQFPTDTSWRANKLTHDLYEVFRSSNELTPRQVHALLATLQANGRLGLHELVPPGLSDQYKAIDTSLTRWMAKDQVTLEDYRQWLVENRLSLPDVLRQFGLDAKGLPAS